MQTALFDEDGILQKAFDLAECPSNIDLSAPPVSGLDYLYRVHLESRQCPSVVVANIDTSRFLSRQTVKVDSFNGFKPAPPELAPSSEWQVLQITQFTSTKKQLVLRRKKLKRKLKKTEYPEIKNMEAWCAFCLGPHVCEQIYGSSSLSETSEDDTNKGTPKKKCRLSTKGNPPFLSILLYLNQPNIVTLLSYHINWLEETGFTHEQGKWIYALLTCLEKPLTPNTCSLLRSLSRLCSRLRITIKIPQDDALKPLNLIICIVANYFDQKDMSDTTTPEEKFN